MERVLRAYCLKRFRYMINEQLFFRFIYNEAIHAVVGNIVNSVKLQIYKILQKFPTKISLQIFVSLLRSRTS